MSLHAGHRLVRGACIAGIVVLIGIRTFYFALESLPPGVESLLHGLLNLDLGVSLLLGVAGALVAASALLVGFALLLVRPRRLVVREGDTWASAPWLHSAAWIVLLCESWMLDVNPELALVGVASLGLLLAVSSRRSILSHGPLWARGAAWVWLLGGALLLARDAADALGVLAWTAALASLAALSRWIAARDRALLALGALAGIQLGVAALPLVVPLHGGRVVARSMAYGFCEAPDRNRLYALVPECRADRFGEELEACRAGYLEEIDTRDPSRVRIHRFFDAGFYGRMEQVACIGDRIQIGMERTMIDGELRSEHVIEMPMRAPERVDRNPLKGLGGARMVYDPASDAIYYLSWSKGLQRLDRRTGRIERVLEGAGFSRGSASAAIHRGRGTLLLLGDRREPIVEVDLSTLEEVGRYPQALGVEIAVDEELARLFVSTLWGLEVYDLASGARLVKHRMGFVGRQATVAPGVDLVFVPTFFEGKLRVFDRTSLEYLGKIPIGMYVRPPYVTADARHLFATSLTAHFYWELSRLAERFRGR